jgi:hypothetical protein
VRRALKHNDCDGEAVMCCPKCGLDYFDNEPDYNEMKKKNDKATRDWVSLCMHIEEYTNGDGIDPLLDRITKKPITKNANPTLKPQLLHCHINQNYQSMFFGGRDCHFKFEVNRKQFKKGECPICAGSCSFVWDCLKT